TALVLTLASMGVASARAPQFSGHGIYPAAAPKATKAATPDPLVIDEGAINDGDSVTGTVDDNNLLHVYTYSGTKGDALTVTMDAPDGLDPFVALSSKDGTVLKSAGAPKGSTKATINYTLRADGDYLIGATRAKLDKGTSSGSYTLTLAVGAASSAAATQIDVSGAAADVVDALRTAGLAPDGGRQLIALDYSFGTTSDVGSDWLRIGQGLQAQNLVIQFQVGWDSAGDTSACGMAFRFASNGDHTSALLSNDGQAILYQTAGKQKIIDYSNPTNSMTLNQANIVTVVAIKDSVTMFVNGTLETTQTGKTAKGVFAIEVYNAKGNTIVTNCTYNNIWIWTFDR
ncbi:MAG: hypothetical protein ACYDEO_20470, partial [Aggregatilineales bacterium]